MGLVSISLPSDGTTADVADYNTPITTIKDEINGQLDNNNIKASAGIDGSKLADASVTNAKLETGAGEPGGAWDSWTPTFSNLSGGTLNYAKYKQVGKTVHYRLLYTLAGAGVAGGVTITTLPTAMHDDYGTSNKIINVGNAMFYDANGAFRLGVAYTNGSATQIQIVATDSSVTYAQIAALSSTVPFTWASGDTISVYGSYEAA